MANGHGGKRENAGRKRKAEKYAGQITEAEDMLAGKLTRLFEKLVELAEGVQAVRHTKQGEIVYDVPPNFAAIKEGIERICGKVAQAVEHTGEDGGPVEHVVFYLPSNGRDSVPDGQQASEPAEGDPAPTGAPGSVPLDPG